MDTKACQRIRETAVGRDALLSFERNTAQRYETGEFTCHCRQHTNLVCIELTFCVLGNVLKIADFGLATHCNNTIPMRSAAVSRWYRPLELFYGARYYSYEIDMWSVGCIVGELLQGKGSYLFF